LQNFGLLALLVFAVTIIFPGLKLVIMLITLLGLEGGILPTRWLKFLFRLYAPIAPWAMVDVYLLGFLVAYTRLAAMATVHLDTALYALIGLVISMAAADAALDDEAVWRALDHLERPGARIAAPAAADAAPIGCRCCNMVNLSLPGDECRRCHAVLQPRIANSVNRCWALVAAAVLLYVPANIYPVMLITRLDDTQPFTIMGGIIELFDDGLWPLAILVFFASITIPLVKLVSLGYMLVKTQSGQTDHLIGRTKLFRMIDFIGRWSMIDVFMISILVALVRFQQLANVQADVGAVCFAGVVVLTMFAVANFDPRLMWDVQDEAVRTAHHHAALRA